MVVTLEAEHVVKPSDLLSLFSGRYVYHAAPLHYLPLILETNRLICARLGARLGIAPRSTAHRRDRMLGVDNYVHLSFEWFTPLLRDKLARGMPHVVLRFDAEKLIESGARRCAILPFNTKAWRSRCDLQPIADPQQIAALLRRHDEFGRCKSLELLIEESLPLNSLVEIGVFCRRDYLLASEVLQKLSPQHAYLLAEHSTVSYAILPIEATLDYCQACILTGRVLPPPKIAFD